MLGIRSVFLTVFIICVFGFAEITQVLATTSSAAEQQPSAPSPQKSQASDCIEILKDIEIGKVGTRVLHADIARPKKLPAAPMPAVMWIHGGAWSSGSHHEMQQTVRLANHGYLVLSAGGHLAALMGVTGDKPDLEGNGGSAGFSSRVQALVDFCGPTVFDGRPEAYSNFTTKMAGGTFEQKPDIFKQMSPLENVNPKACPFLIVNGEKDTMVPLHHAQLMTEALKRSNVPVEMIIVKNAGHGYTLVAPRGDLPAQPPPDDVDAAVLKFLDANLKK